MYSIYLRVCLSFLDLSLVSFWKTHVEREFFLPPAMSVPEPFFGAQFFFLGGFKNARGILTTCVRGWGGGGGKAWWKCRNIFAFAKRIKVVDKADVSGFFLF